MSKSSVYESIMVGLNEALEDAQSEKPVLKRNKVIIEPVKVFEADEVKKNTNFDRNVTEDICKLYGCFRQDS